MTLTTDPEDPQLGRGVDEAPRPQEEVYLVLSEEERAKGFVRPVRQSYVHVGPPGPRYPLRDVTEQDDGPINCGPRQGYVKFEAYPEERRPALGRYWSQAQLDAVGRGCGTKTTMGPALAETYAREPKFYGATYCVGCKMHRPVEEFRWDGTNEVVGS